MCKKVLIAALAVIAAVTVVKFTWLGSHARLWSKSAKNWVESQVNVKTEIDRLRNEVDRLEREDRITLDVVAHQRLDVKAAEERLNKERNDLVRLNKRITELRAALKGPEADVQEVSYNGATYSRAKAEEQMNIDFDRYKPLKGSVAAQEKGVEALRKALSQNEQKLFSGKQRRQEMLTALQELENELAEIRQAQAANATIVDDSGYGRVQRDIQTLKKRLDVEKEKVKITGSLGGGPIEQEEAKKARKESREKEIDAEFGKAPAAKPNGAISLK